MRHSFQRFCSGYSDSTHYIGQSDAAPANNVTAESHAVLKCSYFILGSEGG